MAVPKSLNRDAPEDLDPVRDLYDRQIGRLTRLNQQIAELERCPKDDRLAGRLIETLRREESSLRRTLHTGGAEQTHS